MESGDERSRAARIIAKAGDGGRAARFEDWMRVALYDAELGYYARNVRSVGPRGDFSTAATLHPALGEAVAAWAAARRRALVGRVARWHLVEAGAGTGALAEAVLASLPLVARRTVSLHLVETSPVLREMQRERLGGRATWHATLEDAFDACGGRAIVYASELLDAFPIQVLRATSSGWEELWISCLGEEGGKRQEISSNGGLFREDWRSASSDRLDPPGAFSALSRPWPEGQRVEIAPAVRSLFLSKKSFSSLFSGSLLFLDYGDTIDRLYDRRLNGTVRGYAHHVRLEGPELYRWGGKADITADVNFTDVAAWAAEAKFAVSPIETQAAFLARHVRGAATRAAREPALAFLLDPRGAGAGFKALELSAGISPGSRSSPTPFPRGS